MHIFKINGLIFGDTEFPQVPLGSMEAVSTLHLCKWGCKILKQIFILFFFFWDLPVYMKNNMREGRQTQWESIKISIWITAKTWTQNVNMFSSLESLFKVPLFLSYCFKNYFVSWNLSHSAGLLLFQLFSDLMLFDTILESEKECRLESNNLWHFNRTICFSPRKIN